MNDLLVRFLDHKECYVNNNNLYLSSVKLIIKSVMSIIIYTSVKLFERVSAFCRS